MLDYKQLSRLTIFFSLLWGLAFANTEKQIYSYQEKSNLSFQKVLQDEGTRFLVIDENCSVCKLLLTKYKLHQRENLVLALISEPSFTWLAKLKRQGVKNVLYNINSLGLDFTEGTPQLVEFTSEGEFKNKVYGKSKILTKFFNKARKQ
jgi:hypothetical protein